MPAPLTPAEQAAADLSLLAAATARLLATCVGLDAEAVAAPSRLPGWSRAHVLTHLARNADALRGMLLAARTGATLTPYPSAELRDADVMAGATRPAHLILLDVRASAERFALDAESLDPRTWSRSLVLLRPPSMLAADLPGHRLREVEAHHTDLAAGYDLTQTPAEVLRSFLGQLRVRFAGSALDPAVLVATDLGDEWRIGAGDPGEGTGGGEGSAAGPRIAGPAAALLSWAMGRTGPGGLASDRGDVPPSPGWG